MSNIRLITLWILLGMLAFGQAKQELSGTGETVTLNPSLINMVVGEVRPIQALNSSSRDVIGLTWASSDPTVVSLSNTDPPVLTGLKAGRVIVAAGAASATVTVSAVSTTGGLPLGTIIWSNSGDGSGVRLLLPAWPSTSGVADVFAMMGDGTVLAVDSEGMTAWRADASKAQDIVPNFQGGLVLVNCDNSVLTLDGMTGHVVSTFSVPSGQFLRTFAVHTDGTFFGSLQNGSGNYSIVGIDPTSGNPKFALPLPGCTSSGVNCRIVAGPIVAGDGYAYIAYQSNSTATNNSQATGSLILLRFDSAGDANLIHVQDFSTTGVFNFTVNLITNADTGVLLTWQGQYADASTRTVHRAPGTPYDSTYLPFLGMAVTHGTSVSLVGAPMAPNQRGAAVPILQAQDGSFLGTFYDNDGVENMIAFDASGSVRWVVHNETPQIATADGGVIGASGATYDSNGHVTGQDPLYTQSWTYNMYRGVGSIDRYAALPIPLATSWAFQRELSAPSRCRIE
ncbi:MAG TPA: hypothetical protein VN841_12565 [Bryobacteraceae bacterium]|nr:hypothetical protein [Bryobacteraceae bacterium]